LKACQAESEEYFQQLCSKDNQMQIMTVHLHTAQDELKKLMQEKANQFKTRRENSKEL
jgi:hypothetical protein